MAGETDSGRPAPGAILARIAGAIGIATEGVALSLGVGGHGNHPDCDRARVALGAILVIIAIPIALFFRDPERFPERTEGVVISGADGKVTDVAEVPLPGAAGERYHRVSVFMSPLNVHVNRAPVGWRGHAGRAYAGRVSRGVSRRRERAQRAQPDRADRRSGRSSRWCRWRGTWRGASYAVCVRTIGYARGNESG